MNLDTFPWLTLIGLIPLVGAFILAFFPTEGEARPVALGFSLATLLVTLVALTRFDVSRAGEFQLQEVHRWIPQWGVSYALGVDGLGLAMLGMSVILVPICVLAAWRDIPEGGRRENSYFAWILLLETVIVGLFTATDVFLFYVFFEALIIPVYFLIGSYGGAGRTRAAMKFLLYSLTGGLIMLASVIGLGFAGRGGPHGYLVDNLVGLGFETWTGRLLWLGFFIAFAIKAPMVPVHSWLPDAAGAAKPATAVLLVGVLDKVATFGMLRFCLQLFPEASTWATPVVIALALISIIYGGLAAIGERDLMRLIGFTSVSHFGFIVLGIFAMTKIAAGGSVLYMLNHGFTTAALFLIAGMLVQRGGTADVRAYGGWQRVTPALAGCFLFAGLAALALPGLGSFVSEFLVMLGTFQRYPWVAAISSIGIILAALYVLLLYKRVFTGPVPAHLAHVGTSAGHHVDHAEQGDHVATAGYETDTDGESAHAPTVSVGELSAHGAVDGGAAGHGGATSVAHTVGSTTGGAPGSRRTSVRDLVSRERWVIAPLIVILLALGLYPKPALDVVNPTVERTLQQVRQPEPAPVVPVTSAEENK